MMRAGAAICAGRRTIFRKVDGGWPIPPSVRPSASSITTTPTCCLTGRPWIVHSFER